MQIIIKLQQCLISLLTAAVLFIPSGAVARSRSSVVLGHQFHRRFSAAQEKGTKHGLEGELLYINSGSMNIAALVGGSVQVAGGGPVSIEARLRGIKLLILGNPLPWLASNLVTHPDIKGIPELAGRFAGISRFGSSTDQGFRYLFRKNGLNVDRDLKMLQMGGDSSRVAALKAGTIQ
jgi:ABC-type nitrate/sulfonate/bicarbonate transport system substrate-binding protein